jgi:dTDP-4-amino-4,6-dideoxygalactose transaminase
MDKEGISTGILYDPPLNKTLLAKNKFGTDISMPVSEWLAPRVVSLPIFPEMADYEITKIYGAVEKILKNLK